MQGGEKKYIIQNYATKDLLRPDQRKELLLQDLLWKACCEGDTGMLQRLIEKYEKQERDGVRINGSAVTLKQVFSNVNKYNEGRTALFAACFSGQADCASFLLEKGADVNQADNSGCSALFIACGSGHLNCASLLIDRGANVNHIHNVGHSALFAASGTGHHTCVSLLLERGANINQIDHDGITALFPACEMGQYKCASILIANGINVNQLHKDGHNAMFAACRNGHYAIVSLLLANGINVNQKDKKEGRTALHLSILMGHVRIVFHLLDYGAEVTEYNKHAAVIGNSVKVLAMVLRRVGLEHINENNSGGLLLRLTRHLKRSEEIASFLEENGVIDNGFIANPHIFGISQQEAQKLYKLGRGERKNKRTCDHPDCNRDVPMEQLKKCSKCQEYWYCGKEHQQGHWPVHKAMCEKLRLYV